MAEKRTKDALLWYKKTVASNKQTGWHSYGDGLEWKVADAILGGSQNGKALSQTFRRDTSGESTSCGCFAILNRSVTDALRSGTDETDSKTPGCHCVKSEYAPSPEWEYFEYEMSDDDCETWRQPSIEEVDAMLKSIL